MAIIHGEGRSFISKNKIIESKNNLTRPFDIKQKIDDIKLFTIYH